MSNNSTYTPQEEQWNIWTHGISAAIIPVLYIILLTHVHSGINLFATTLYSLSLLAMFLGSTIYHATKDPDTRKITRKVDHSMIYILISGTYTPLMLIAVGGTTGAIILSISWTIAVVGIFFKIIGREPFRGFSLFSYLLSGWLCIFVFPRLFHALSVNGLIYLFAGGVTYTAGVFFFVKDWVGAHAIWHFFVMGGAFLHYMAVLSML